MPTIAEHLATATDDYLSNVPPFLTVTQCRAFIGACAKLIMLTPSMSGTREGQTQFNIESLQKQQDAAQQWLDNNGGTPAPTDASSSAPRVTYADFTGQIR